MTDAPVTETPAYEPPKSLDPEPESGGRFAKHQPPDRGTHA